MADKKLSELTELDATPAADDEVYIRDVSEEAAAESKRITVANLLAGAGGWDKLAKAYNAGNQTIDNTTVTTLTFDSEEFDTDTIHNTSSDTSRLTCKTAGKYLVHAQVSWAADAVGRRLIIILKDSTSIARGEVVPVTGAVLVQNALTIVDLKVNEYVEIQVYQSSGDPLDVSGGSDDTFFEMVRVG